MRYGFIIILACILGLIGWITDAIFEKAFGRHARGKTRYYISSGLGIWGPKIRIGTRSEYLVLHIIPE